MINGFLTKNLLTTRIWDVYTDFVADGSAMELQTLLIRVADNRLYKILADFLCPVAGYYVQAKAKSNQARIHLSECLNHRTPLFKQMCLRGLLLISSGVHKMTNLIIKNHPIQSDMSKQAILTALFRDARIWNDKSGLETYVFTREQYEHIKQLADAVFNRATEELKEDGEL